MEIHSTTISMWFTFSNFGIIVLLVASQVVAKAGDEMKDSVREYCQWEVFNATCGADQVVLMESAEYGRMRLARCLQRDYGYVGCKDNVLKYVDSKCSGRRRCAFTVPDPVLDKLQPCPNDLKAYMEASYTCLKVVTGDGQLCRGPVRLSATSGYIASVVTQEMQIGSASCPWLIQADRGQRVIITLYDFALWTDAESASVSSSRAMGHRPPESSGICHIYAQIKEKTAATAVTLCGGERRRKIVYTSESESVRVEMANMRNSKAPSYFLLHYEVTGCPAIVASPNLIVDRLGDMATVTCKSTGDSWQMSCSEGVWSGKSKNCTEVKAWGLTDFIENAISLPQGVLIVIILGIALFIAVIILAVGLWTLRRRQHEPPSDKDTSLVAPSGHHYAGRRSVSEACTKEHYPMLANPERGQHDRRGESEYTSTWQRRAQVPATRVYPDGTIHRMEYDAHTLELARARCPPYTLQSNHSAVPPGCGMTSSPVDHHHVEHIYESPKFERKPRGEYGDGPFYHELDPDRLSTSSSQPDLVLNPETVAHQAGCGHSILPMLHHHQMACANGGGGGGLPGWPDSNSNMVLDDGNMCGMLSDFPPPPDLPPPNISNMAK